MEHQENAAILEEEKNSNPIFRIVFNRLKFLRGKLAQIAHIRTLDHNSLKPAQLAKLQKLPEITQEIQKNEEFIRYYRSILVEHNLSDRKVDDLLKISTLFTVGRRMQAHHYCPKEARELYETFNNSIFGKGRELSASQLSDEVVRVYELLWDFLQDDTYYSQCRDYLTYLEEIDQRKAQEGTNLPAGQCYSGQKHSNVEKVEPKLDYSIIAEINRKMERLELQSQIIKIDICQDFIINTPNISSAETQSQSIIVMSDKDIDYKQQCSTTNPEGSSETKDLDREPLDAITHPEVVWIKKNQSFEADDECRTDIVDDLTSDRPNAKKKRHRKPKKTVFAEMDCIRKGSEATQDWGQERQRVKVKYVEKKSG